MLPVATRGMAFDKFVLTMLHGNRDRNVPYVVPARHGIRYLATRPLFLLPLEQTSNKCSRVVCPCSRLRLCMCWRWWLLFSLLLSSQVEAAPPATTSSGASFFRLRRGRGRVGVLSDHARRWSFDHRPRIPKHSLQLQNGSSGLGNPAYMRCNWR